MYREREIERERDVDYNIYTRTCHRDFYGGLFRGPLIISLYVLIQPWGARGGARTIGFSMLLLHGNLPRELVAALVRSRGNLDSSPLVFLIVLFSLI